MSAVVSAKTLQTEIRGILAQHADQLSEVTPRFVRSQLEQRLGFMKDELASQKKEISSAIQEALADMQSGVKSEPAPVASFSALSSTPAATPASRSAESQKQLNASKKRALSAAAGDEDDFDSDDDGAAKRRKSEASNGPHVTVVGAPDPNTVKLSDNKRIEVRVFKKMVLIDIRETYTDKTSGEEKPGKKGISLKPEQWELLLKNASKVNAAIARLQ